MFGKNRDFPPYIRTLGASNAFSGNRSASFSIGPNGENISNEVDVRDQFAYAVESRELTPDALMGLAIQKNVGVDANLSILLGYALSSIESLSDVERARLENETQQAYMLDIRRFRSFVSDVLEGIQMGTDLNDEKNTKNYSLENVKRFLRSLAPMLDEKARNSLDKPLNISLSIADVILDNLKGRVSVRLRAAYQLKAAGIDIIQFIYEGYEEDLSRCEALFAEYKTSGQFAPEQYEGVITKYNDLWTGVSEEENNLMSNSGIMVHPEFWA